ncbi:uncharacterized protein LOC113356488 [Papaver somniferum]|uniref:uncharacterized protein LOC113356488 n=1 Tax=Papaver somniferum TaxID=3469 RepID=UPI000E7044A9|nr:uncharacterized protein LOC113356488 [Papaver somniferum]
MGDQFDSSQPKLYAEKLQGRRTLPSTTIDLSKLPNPTVKEGKPAVILPQEYYEEGCEVWRFSLIGILDFKDINFTDAKKELESQWQLGNGRVQFIPMVRGFFIIKLLSQEDKNKIFDAEAWIVDHQKLNLLEWYPSFDPQKQKTSHATVWVKFPGLPMEFWLEKTLLAMAKTIGTPIVVDQRTLAHEYGYYASVLIDINFAELDTDSIHVTVGGLDFWQKFDIHKRPKFCSYCKIIGHADGECRKKNNSANQQYGNARPNSRQNRSDNRTADLRYGDGTSNGAVIDGQDWQVAQRKKRKSAPHIPVVPEVHKRVDEAFNEEYTVQLEKAKQLEIVIAKSKADMEAASVELARTKQVLDSNSVLVESGLVGETRTLQTKSGLVGNQIPNLDRTNSSTPLCDEFMAGEQLLTRNKFNLLKSTDGTSSSLEDRGALSSLETNKMRSLQTNCKGNKTGDQQAAQSKQVSYIDSSLGKRDAKGSSPRIMPGEQVKITKPSKPGF